MEEGILTEEKDVGMIKKLIEDIVIPRGYKQIRANVPDFETPARLSRPNEDESFIPDATGVLNGRKSYFELAMKSDDIQEVITKWKLLSNLASFKEGRFFLIVPHGNLAFTNRILKKYPIRAEILRL